MATKNKKDIVTDLLANIYHNINKEVTAEKVRAPITDLINSVAVNLTIAQLRAEDDSGEPSFTNVLDAGKRGIFFYDSTDVTTTDDGAVCLVTTTGKRYKRIIESGIDARWYGQANYYFPDIATAIANVKAFIRYVGLEVTVMYQGNVTGFWFGGGVTDGDLVLKYREPHDIQFTIGDGGGLTPVDGTTDYLDPKLLNGILIGVFAAGRKLRYTLYPAVLGIADLYAQFNPNADGTNGKVTIKNGTYNDTSDYSITYK